MKIFKDFWKSMFRPQLVVEISSTVKINGKTVLGVDAKKIMHEVFEQAEKAFSKVDDAFNEAEKTFDKADEALAELMKKIKVRERKNAE